MSDEENFDELIREEDSENALSKVPFDEVPISRSGFRQRTTSVKPQAGKRSFENRTPVTTSKINVTVAIYALLAILFAINVITGSFLIKLYGDYSNKYTPVYVTYNIENPSDEMVQAAVAKGYQSTCAIACSASSVDMNNENDFFSNGTEYGSGVVFSVDKTTGDMYIATNFHVAFNTNATPYDFYNYIWVLLSDSLKPIQMEVVGGTASYDVAVLKCTGNNEVKVSSCSAVEFGDTTQLQYGTKCIAIGNSLSAGIQATTGVIALEEEFVTGKNNGLTVSMCLLRHSAEINGGNSGGGLFDSQGKFIGLVNGRHVDPNDSSNAVFGMNLAVPSSIVQNVANNIIYFSQKNTTTVKFNLYRPDLGIYFNEIYNVDRQKQNANCFEVSKSVDYTATGARTVYEIKVQSNTNGFVAGDIIKSFSYQDKTIVCDRLFSLDSHIYNLREGDVITFTVEREGSDSTIDVPITVTSFNCIF